MKYTDPHYSCDYLNFFIEQRINPINQKSKDYVLAFHPRNGFFEEPVLSREDLKGLADFIYKTIDKKNNFTSCMIYGNCLFCALFLMWRERYNNPKFILKYRPGTYVPHFMVRTQDRLHHFKVVKNILFWPFCYIIFAGQFQTINISEADDYNK